MYVPPITSAVPAAVATLSNQPNQYAQYPLATMDRMQTHSMCVSPVQIIAAPAAVPQFA